MRWSVRSIKIKYHHENKYLLVDISRNNEMVKTIQCIISQFSNNKKDNLKKQLHIIVLLYCVCYQAYVCIMYVWKRKLIRKYSLKTMDTIELRREPRPPADFRLLRRRPRFGFSLLGIVDFRWLFLDLILGRSWSQNTGYCLDKGVGAESVEWSENRHDRHL